MTSENRHESPSCGGNKAAERLTAFPRPNKRKTRRWVVAGLVVLALAGAVAWHASQRVSTGSANGGRLVPPGPVAPLKKTFRIGTFNIHAGRSADGHLDLARTAKSLTGLDFVGLNEVAGRWPWEASDQAEQLGRQTGQAALFAPFERRWYCHEFGNALLTSLPVCFWMRAPLSESTDRPRNALVAAVEHGNRTMIRAIVIHAARQDAAQRDREISWAVGDFLDCGPPVVLLGDLNAGPDHPVLTKLLKTPGVVDALAGAPGVPKQRIDWILLRGLRAVHAGMVDQGASDHPLFWAEVELAPGVQ